MLFCVSFETMWERSLLCMVLKCYLIHHLNVLILILKSEP